MRVENETQAGKQQSQDTILSHLCVCVCVCFTYNSNFFFQFKKKNCVHVLQLTFHLQLLQNIGYIPCGIQYIFEPILQPIVLPPTLPIALPTGNH